LRNCRRDGLVVSLGFILRSVLLVVHGYGPGQSAPRVKRALTFKVPTRRSVRPASRCHVGLALVLEIPQPTFLGCALPHPNPTRSSRGNFGNGAKPNLMRLPEYGTKSDRDPSRVGSIIAWICVLVMIAAFIAVGLWIHSLTYRVFSVPR